MIEISRELENLRQKLLDLTLRNKLIHHFPSKKRTIEVIDESPRELYDILVLQEKSMRFKPTKIKDEIEEEQEENGDENPHMWIEPDDKDDGHKYFFDLYINTPYDYEKLMDRLFYTYNQSHSFFEEQGYSVLYLAIGFLEWKESSNAQKVINSPLILIPVELSRIGKRRDFSLTWTGDDIVTSLTLQGKLSERGVELPDFNMPDDKSGIDQYFQEVRKSVQNQTDWIISDKIVLDFFNFRKYLMYKDLDSATWPSDRVPATHPLIQSIFNPQPTEPSDYIISEDEVDTKIKSSSSLVVLDADSSQLAAIEAIKGKKNLVVQGPPGTGKSQTIANLIAELIGLGKSVLFVSEKMAALEVVKKRLDNVGLGIFCLELHSNKAKKTEVLKELQKTLTLRGTNTFSNDHEIDELDDIKKQLNTYVTVLHAPFGRRNLSPYALFSLKAKVELYFQKLNRKMKIIPISNPETISQEQWSHAVSNLEKTIGLVGMLPAFKDNPWKLCSPNIILPPDKEVIRSDIYESIEKYNILLKNLNIFSELTGMPQAATKTDVIKMKDAIDILDNHPPVTKAMLSNNNWNNTQLVKGLIQDISVYQSEREEFQKLFNYTIIDKDYKEHIKNYDSLIERLKVELVSSYPQSQIPQKMCDMHQHLRLCVQRNILKKNVIDFDQYGKSFFGKYWLGVRSNPEQLESILKIIVLCQNWKRNNILPESSFYILENGFNPDFIISGNITDKLNLASNAIKLLEKHQILHKKVSSTFKPDIIDQDVEGLKSQFEYQSSLFLRSLRPGYRSLKKQLSEYYSISPPSDDTRLLEDISQVINYNQTKKLMTTHKAHLRQLFGRYWNDNTTDPNLLRDYIKLIKLFYDGLEDVNSTYLHIFDSGLHQDVLKNPSLHYQMNDIEKVINSLNDYHKTDTIIKETGLIFVEEANYDGIYSDIEYYIDTIQKEVGPFYINNDCSDVDTVIAQLKKLDALQERSKEIFNNHNGRDLFGEHWKGIDSEPAHLQQIFDWITIFRKYWHSGIFTELTIGKVDSNTIKRELPQLYQNIEKYDEIFNDSIVHLSNVLKFSIPEVFGEEYGLVEYKTIIRQLEIWHESIDILDKWSHYLDYRNKLIHSVALPLIEHIENESILSQDALYTLEGNYADGILKQVFRQYPVMTEFIGELHNQKINNFRLLDERFIDNNRKRLYSRMSSAVPELSAGSSRNSEAGILLGEFNKKRNILPIRKLMLRASRLIQSIKPCFMMSPLSIAQFLDPRTVNFDIIVFDEASQVRPEDALGALLRGDQLVVMGDTKQLPPTRFFDSLGETADENEDDEIASATDMESILNLCLNSFMTKTLRWHYRSRHESLIAVSNQEFYDNQLFVYPSPQYNSPLLGLQFIHYPDTIYDRGRSGINREEARRVAKLVLEHFKHNPDKTLGVGTFNVKQQEAILQELEVLVRQNPSIERLFTNDKGENFFVKNIETIQGDERDVIIISIGFGYDRYGKISRNFGPINQEGGERRLNVLMTRAREKCILVSNFTSNDLIVDDTSPKGLRVLKVFLKYASIRTLDSSLPPMEDSDSPFEEYVYEWLRNQGFEVHKQVGCAGYRIDLAVVDPNNPGEYLIGIECDGAQYHSSKVARDRDRLRQEILERLGWTIHRIWSTDWYRHNTDAQKAALAAISASNNKIKAKPNNKVKKTLFTTNAEWLEESNSQMNSGDIKIYDQENYADIDTDIPEYQQYSRLSIPCSGNLEDINENILINAIVELVNNEGPIHKSLIIIRIRDACGLKRAGNRIQEYVTYTISKASQRNQIIQKGDFLWPIESTDNPVLRKRTTKETLSIELICPEEIEEAILYVLKKQHATAKVDLAIQTSRLLGFRVNRAGNQKKIEAIIEKMLQENKLQQLPNGMINIT